MSLVCEPSTRTAPVDPTVLADRIVELGRRLGVVHHELVHTLARFDTTGWWQLTHPTCAAWVADTLAVAVGTAREWLRVGHALASLSQIDAAFAAGRLSYRQVRTLTRVAVDHPDRETELLALTERTAPRDLAIALARWTSRFEDPAATDRRHARETSLSSRIEPDGMGVITIRLPPIAMGAVMAAIDAALMTRPRASTDASGSVSSEAADSASTDASGGQRTDAGGQEDAASTDASGGPERSEQAAGSASVDASTPARTGTCPSERPSLAQQRAWAFVQLVTGGGAKVATEVIVHVRADGNHLHDGTPISDHTVARLLPGAFIRTMIHDAQSHPIDVSGRHRYPTDRQRLVVLERQPRCDCGATEFLEIHHDPPFEESHRTIIDELRPHCGRCHRRWHAQHEAKRKRGRS
jgi:ribosomal protein S27AE